MTRRAPDAQPVSAVTHARLVIVHVTIEEGIQLVVDV